MHSAYQHEPKEKAQSRSTGSAFQAMVEHPSHTVVHAKLEMTTPDSPEEVEADVAAGDIVQGKVARSSFAGGTGGGTAVSAQMESQLGTLQGKGQQMPQGLRSMMERGFGRDFSQVRLHTDSTAADMSASIHARAFTHGSDIYFNRGQYNPNTTEGQRLVAHELAHVAQGGGKVARDSNLSAKENVDNYKKGLDVYTLLLYVFQKKNIIDKGNPREAQIILQSFFYAHKEDTWYWPMKSYFKEYAEKCGLGSKEKIKTIANRIDDAGFFVNAPIPVIVKLAEDIVGEEIYRSYYDSLEQNLRNEGKKIPSFNKEKDKRTWLESNALSWGYKDDVYTDAALDVFMKYHSKDDALSKNLALIAGFKVNKVKHPKDYFQLPDNYIDGNTWTALFFAYSAIPVSFFFSELAVAADGVLMVTAINTAGSIVTTLMSDIPKLSSGELNSTGVLADVVGSAIIAALVSGIGEKIGKEFCKTHLKAIVKEVIASLATDFLTQLKEAILKKDVEWATFLIKTLLHAILTAVMKHFQGVENLSDLESKFVSDSALMMYNGIGDFVVDESGEKIKSIDASQKEFSKINDEHNSNSSQ